MGWRNSFIGLENICEGGGGRTGHIFFGKVLVRRGEGGLIINAFPTGDSIKANKVLNFLLGSEYFFFPLGVGGG